MLEVRVAGRKESNGCQPWGGGAPPALIHRTNRRSVRRFRRLFATARSPCYRPAASACERSSMPSSWQLVHGGVTSARERLPSSVPRTRRRPSNEGGCGPLAVNPRCEDGNRSWLFLRTPARSLMFTTWCSRSDGTSGRCRPRQPKPSMLSPRSTPARGRRRTSRTSSATRSLPCAGRVGSRWSRSRVEAPAAPRPPPRNASPISCG